MHKQIGKRPPLKLKSADFICMNRLDTAYESTTTRLQLQPGWFWHGLHPNMHELVSEWISRLENLTDSRRVAIHVFSIRKLFQKK